MGLIARARAALIPNELPDTNPCELRTDTAGVLWVRLASGLVNAVTALLQLSSSGASGQVTMTGSAVQISATPSAYANGLLLGCTNASSSPVYWGWANTVTTSGATGGGEIIPGAIIPVPVGDVSKLWFIGTSGMVLHWVGLG